LKYVIFDEETKEFYLLANKKKGKIGNFLIKFSESDPSKCENLSIHWTGLDIGNVNLSILHSYDPLLKAYLKELVISYKTIFYNTYNIWVYDISGPFKNRSTLYLHESF